MSGLPLETRLERRFGYTRAVELLNAILCVCRRPLSFLRYQWLTFRAFALRKPVVVVHVSMPQYLESIGGLPGRLVEAGAEVFVFAEWRTELHPEYRLKPPPGVRVFHDCWYFLPFTAARLSVVTAARKHRYYPAMARRLHCFHGLASLSGFPRDGFLSYDVFFCAGPHQRNEIRDYVREHGLSGRLVVRAGYPKLDQLHERFSASGPRALGERPTVIYCPTYYTTDPSFDRELSLCSTAADLAPDVIRALLTRYRVIFRPHPLNLKHGNLENVLKRIRSEFGSDPHFRFDEEISYFDAYLESDAMVSDISGTAFTYALSLGKPVVFLDRGIRGKGIHFEERDRIGERVTDVSALIPALEGLLCGRVSSRRIEDARRTLVYHFGSADSFFAEATLALLRGESVPESEIL